LINLFGVYHYDPIGATAECSDLFSSPIYRRRRAPKELLCRARLPCTNRFKTHAGFSIASVSRPSAGATVGADIDAFLFGNRNRHRRPSVYAPSVPEIPPSIGGSRARFYSYTIAAVRE